MHVGSQDEVIHTGIIQQFARLLLGTILVVDLAQLTIYASTVRISTVSLLATCRRDFSLSHRRIVANRRAQSSSSRLAVQEHVGTHINNTRGSVIHFESEVSESSNTNRHTPITTLQSLRTLIQKSQRRGFFIRAFSADIE